MRETITNNRPFPSSSQPPFQSEAKCEAFVMKNFALRLALKERLRGTRKWPIGFPVEER